MSVQPISYRLLILSSNGTQLACVQKGDLPSDSEANFRGILTILEPISRNETSFLFSMRLGPFQVDIAYYKSLYAFAIIPARSKENIIKLNSFLAEAAVLTFADLASGMISLDTSSQVAEKVFNSQAPSDPFSLLPSIIESLHISNVNYIAFVAQGHRVIYSIGDTKLPPDQFIVSWCEALESIDGIDKSNSYAQVSNRVINFQLLPGIVAIVFYQRDISQSEAATFLSKIPEFVSHLKGIFKNQQAIKVQMPSQPMSSRRPPIHRV